MMLLDNGDIESVSSNDDEMYFLEDCSNVDGNIVELIILQVFNFLYRGT